MPASDAAPQPALLRQLLLACRWWAGLRHHELDDTRLAAREGVTASCLTHIVRLAFLAPDLADIMVAGTQQAQVDAGAITRTPLLACWKAQRAMVIAVGACDREPWREPRSSSSSPPRRRATSPA